MLAIAIVYFLLFLVAVFLGLFTDESEESGCLILFVALFSLLCCVMALLDFFGVVDSGLFFETMAEASMNSNL